jgi:2-dehydro-3-deoxyphosphooctonate aldolase (KDO 8-P synthase)
MKNVIKKIEDTGNDKILLTERGVSFGYNTLVSDMRSLSILSDFGYPVVFDATHSVQQPGGKGDSSGGERKFISLLSRAAVAVGISTIFLETHDNPDKAPSDGANMIPLTDLEHLLKNLIGIDKLIKTK